MKSIKMKLTTWMGLLIVCLLPIGARAADHHKSGIVGSVDSSGAYNVIRVSDGRNSISVPIDGDGVFKVDLKPGRYVLTPCFIPVAGPGQPYPNFFLIGPAIRARVTEHHFTIVEIPVLHFPFPPSGGPITS